MRMRGLSRLESNPPTVFGDLGLGGESSGAGAADVGLGDRGVLAERARRSSSRSSSAVAVATVVVGVEAMLPPEALALN